MNLKADNTTDTVGAEQGALSAGTDPTYEIPAGELEEWMTAAPKGAAEDSDDPFPAIPARLKSLKRWLLHRDKVPHYTDRKKRNGVLDDPADVAQLASYAEALAALKTHPEFGLGFAIVAGDDVIALDADKVLGNEKEADAMALLGNTYIETSPSGNGLHAFYFGKFKPARKKVESFECYTEKRFFTMTGLPISGSASDVTDATTEDLERIASTFGIAGAESSAESKRTDPFATYTNTTLSPQQIKDARAVIALMRDKGMHLKPSSSWHEVIGCFAPYGAQGVDLANEFSVGCPSYTPEDVTKKIKDKLRRGATGIGRLFDIAAEVGITNPATGRRPSDQDDSAEEIKTADFTSPVWEFKPLNMGKVMSDEPKPLKWLFHQRVPGNRGALLTGLGGTSKTQMLYQMAIAAILGNCPWGWSVDRTGKAVMILTEDDENDPHITLHTIKTAMGLTAEQCRKIEERLTVFPLAGQDLKLMIRDPKSGSLIESDHLRGFEEVVKGIGGVVFIGIDPALGVTEGDEASQSDQRALGRMADNLAVRCDCSVFILTHGTKGSLNSEELTSHSSRGGGAITDAVRAEYGMRTMTSNEAKKYGIGDIAERESYVQLKATKGNRIPPDAKVPVWLRRSQGGYLEAVELRETKRGGISPLAQRVLDVMVEMDPDNKGVRLQDWRNRCIEKKIIDCLGNDAQKMAMRRALEKIGKRITKHETARGIYLRNFASFDNNTDDDYEDAA